MIKARATSNEGTPLYVLGLAPENVTRLKAGNPIYFAGVELNLPDHHFLIVHAEDGETLSLAHEQYAQGDPRRLHSFGLSDAVLERLKKAPAVFHSSLDGQVVFMVGEPEEIGARLGLSIAGPVPRGYRDELDPITGCLVRKLIPTS